MHLSSLRRLRRYRATSVIVLVFMTITVFCLSIMTFIATHASLGESSFKIDIGNLQKLSTRLKKKEQFCTGNMKQSEIISVVQGWDFKHFRRPTLLKNFKNPCFFEDTSSQTSNTSSAGGSRPELRCLPYFIVAGFPKAGTTDLWSRLLNHPDIVARHVKEPMFFNIGRFEYQAFDKAADRYIKFYSKAARVLERLVSPAECHGTFPYHHGITGEASVDTAFDNSHWQQLPGNAGCTEPVVTTADYVHRINPNIKTIFMVRNPVDRLYSDYIYEARFLPYKTSQKDFHDTVVRTIHNFTECMQHRTTRACAYDSSIETPKVRLRVGLYHVFIEDWLELFPNENILVVKSEDMLEKTKFSEYKKVCRFLKIRPFTRLEEVTIFYRGPMNSRSLPERDVGDVWPETRAILDNFYEPFNHKLSKLFPYINY